MADFGTAIKWMKEGKKVRRPMWNDWRYCHAGPDGEAIYQVNSWGHDSPMTTRPTQAVMANDWELFEELPRWREGDTAYIRVRVVEARAGRNITRVETDSQHQSSMYLFADDLLTAAEAIAKDKS